MSQGTTSEDYSNTYYNEAHLGGEGEYGWENDHWRGFFRMVADRIIGITNPTTVLDVGCAKGILVQALREKGVDAAGFDISDHAVAAAHADVREHLWVGSATDPIAGRYSLVTCIEVLEHMAPDEAQRAIDRICEVTDLVLFSSSPYDHREPTHVNTRPTAQWASSFAERGFFRRTDVDLSSLTPWAMLLERSTITPAQLVQRYEAQHAVVNTELIEKRESLLASHRETSQLRAELAAGTTAQLAEQVELVKAFEKEVLEARHALLVNRDHAIGVEAEVGRLNREVTRLTYELRRNKQRVAALEKRRDALTDRVEELRGRLAESRTRNKALQSRMAAVEGAGTAPSLATRIARRLRGARR